MGLRQIGHMDIVADAGPVRCRVVLTEQCDRLPGLDGPKEQRNKVCLRLVLLTETGAWFRAARVEISKTDASKASVLVEPRENLLDHDFGLAVRAHRGIREVLENGNALGRSVNRG